MQREAGKAREGEREGERRRERMDMNKSIRMNMMRVGERLNAEGSPWI